MTTIEELAASLGELRIELAAERAKGVLPGTMLRSVFFEMSPADQMTAVKRGIKLADPAPERKPPRTLPPNSIWRADFDQINSPLEKARIAKSLSIVD